MIILNEVSEQVSEHGRIYPQDRPLGYIKDFFTSLDVDTDGWSDFDFELKFKQIIFKLEKVEKELKKAEKEIFKEYKL